MTPSRLLSMAVAGLSIICGTCLAAVDAPSYRLFPLPFEVAGQTMPTHFVLRIREQEFGSSLKIASPRVGPEAEILNGVVRAVQQDDFPSYLKWSSQTNPEEAKGFFEGYLRGTMPIQEEALLARAFYLGDCSYYVFESRSAQSPISVVPVFHEAGKYKSGMAASLMKPIFENVSELARAMQNHPEEYATISTEQIVGYAKLVLSSPDPAKETIHLLLPLQPVKFSLFNEVAPQEVAPDNLKPYLSFYERSSRELLNGHLEKYTETFEPQSRSVLKRYLARLDSPDSLKAYQLRQSYARDIVCVVGTGNVIALFSRAAGVNGVRLEDLIIKSESGVLQRVSAEAEGPLVRLLSSPEVTQQILLLCADQDKAK